MKTLKRELDNKQTITNYKNVAWFYNSWSWLTESKAAKKVLELADIQNGDNVVEIACGTGLVFQEIVKRNPNGTNVGVDLSDDMLLKAKNLLKKSKLENYNLQQGDVFNLDLEKESFDKLVNNFMIDLLPEEMFDDILKVFYDLLKPNGIAVISTFSFGKKKINNFWVWTAKHFPKLLTNCRPVNIKDNLEKAGFKILEEIEISQNTFPSKVYKARK